MRLRWLCIGLAWLATGAAHGAASTELVKFDPQHSQASFDVHVMWLFAVEGRFGEITGDVSIDRPAQTARVSAEIDTRALQMRSESNTAWAKSAEFFDTARYPLIHFVSEPFPLAVLHEGGDIPGSLTVRGHTAQAIFNLRPRDCADPLDPACPVLVDGAIKRSDFGMRSRRGTLSDKVRLYLAVQVKHQP